MTDEPGKGRKPRKARKPSKPRKSRAAKAKAPLPSPPPPAMPVGRPTIFSQDLADTICLLISEGCSVREIGEMAGLPGTTTIFRWLVSKPLFREQYALAKEAGAEVLADELIAIADDGSNDYMLRTGRDGSEAWVLNGEHVQRSKLRVDTRKWVLAKLLPKKYGDRVAIEDAVPDDLPDDERASRIAAFLDTARARRDSAANGDGADVEPSSGASDTSS